MTSQRLRSRKSAATHAGRSASFRSKYFSRKEVRKHNNLNAIAPNRNTISVTFSLKDPYFCGPTEMKAVRMAAASDGASGTPVELAAAFLSEFRHIPPKVMNDLALACLGRNPLTVG
jgi:hypothetical protein